MRNIGLFLFSAFTLFFAVTAYAAYDLKAMEVGFVPEGMTETIDTINVGQRGTLRSIIHNREMDDADRIHIRIVINGVSAGEGQIDNIRSGEMSVFEIPGYTFNTPGSHSISMFVDTEKTLTETNEKNNIIASTIQVNSTKIGTLQDIAATDILFIPHGSMSAIDEVPVFQEGKLRGVVRNTGQTIISDVSVKLEIDGKISRQGSIENIPVGGSGTFEFDYRFPVTRIHIVRLLVDPDHKITELNERNNTMHKEFQVYSTVDAEAFGIAFYPGEGQYRIEEIDIRDMGNIRVSVFNPLEQELDKVDLKILVNDHEVGTGHINSIRHLAKKNFNLSYKFTKPGAYTLKLVVDPENHILETNEMNNTITRDVTVNITQNLRVVNVYFVPDGSVQGTLKTRTGQRGTLIVEIRNDAAKGMSQRAIVRVTKERVIINEGDLNSFPAASTNYYRIERFSFNLPGGFKIRAKVDPDNNIFETNENDNHHTSVFSVSGSAKPKKEPKKLPEPIKKK
ncbi:MAG: hypothetical protein KAI40_06135 [Desulfobacterales bacterium]|nr:hypothetical protein [Desulfobacterales bacterium]